MNLKKDRVIQIILKKLKPLIHRRRYSHAEEELVPTILNEGISGLPDVFNFLRPSLYVFHNFVSIW